MKIKRQYITPYLEFSFIEVDGEIMVTSPTKGTIPDINQEDGGYWGDAKSSEFFDFEAEGGFSIGE